MWPGMNLLHKLHQACDCFTVLGAYQKIMDETGSMKTTKLFVWLREYWYKHTKNLTAEGFWYCHRLSCFSIAFEIWTKQKRKLIEKGKAFEKWKSDLEDGYKARMPRETSVHSCTQLPKHHRMRTQQLLFRLIFTKALAASIGKIENCSVCSEVHFSGALWN